MQEVSLKELLEAGCHFGHQAKRWNPKMKQYLYIARGGVHIFDLVKTKAGLDEAMKYVESLVKDGKQIIFVGTKRQAQGIVKEAAMKVGMPYITTRWMGGLLTNNDQIGKSIKKLVELRKQKSIGKFVKYTKREQLLIDREIDKLTKFLGGLTELKGAPGAVFVVDTHKEAGSVKEARSMGVPVVGLVDSNADPDVVDYVIPVNDDAVKSIQLVVAKITEAVESGLEKFKKASKDGGEKKE